jgi:hypothetical protein
MVDNLLAGDRQSRTVEGDEEKGGLTSTRPSKKRKTRLPQTLNKTIKVSHLPELVDGSSLMHLFRIIP